jgi:hypothetical protein
MKKKKTIKKATPKAVKKVTKDEKIRAELRELRKTIKKAKKSKRRMQFLWYRTKKEHVALLKDIETRLKALKKALAKK